MKLEFLADGSQDCPLIRLYDFDFEEAVSLRQIVASLSDGTPLKDRSVVTFCYGDQRYQSGNRSHATSNSAQNDSRTALVDCSGNQRSMPRAQKGRNTAGAS